ncbi:MAG: hypothetical protein HGA85_01590 [Nanoarchaeota archaeon]|nr:hypothetical protein [Nanoarchaeota archaeon]
MKGWKIYVIIGIILAAAVFADPDPLGATLTPGSSSRGTNPTVTTADAQAGNVTALNINQDRITDIWQGFYGNVSGSVVLENAAGNNFYDWSLATITGEVYASRATVPSWTSINCTNQTQIDSEETLLSIATTASDGINETFNITSHPNFNVGTRLMTGCFSTRAYNSTGSAGNYWNVLLSSNSTNVVYTSILADNADAFAGSTADFEILVPVDRLLTTSTYYFYVELN